MTRGQGAKIESTGARWFWAVLTTLVIVVASLAPAPGAEASVGDELAAAQSKADALVAQLSDLETELALLEDQIAELEAEAQEIEAELIGLRAEVRKVAVDRYMNASNPPTIWTPDPLESGRLDALMGAVQADSNKSINAYREASQRLDRSTSDLTDRVKEQEQAQADLVSNLEDLHRELDRLAELQRQAEREAARREAERKRQAEAARHTPVTATTLATGTPTNSAPPAPPSSNPSPPTTGSTPSPTTPPSTAPPAPTTTTTAPPPTTVPPASPPPPSSGFLCPVTPSSFIDSFGAPRSGGRRHMGVDMHAPIGTPTIAPVSGRVEHRGNSVGGLSYHLYGDDGNYYYGTHLSRYGASGQVAAGTVIGYVGDTGNAAGIPHLHFEIHPGGPGNAINPTPKVRAAC